MTSTSILQKVALLLCLALLTVLADHAQAQAPIAHQYSIANFSLQNVVPGTPTKYTYQVTINLGNSADQPTPRAIYFGAYQTTGTVFTGLLPSKPSACTVSNSTPGWTPTISGNAPGNYQIKFIPSKTANPQVLGFTFTTTDSIATLRAISTSPNVNKALYPVFLTNVLVLTSTPTYFNYLAVPPLPLTITNVKGGAQAWITFETSTGIFSATYVHAATGKVIPITSQKTGDADFSTPVSLTQCGGQLYLNYIDSGVVYVYLGNNPAPIQSSPSAPISTSRWSAACEITYCGNPADSGDLTQINCFSFPLSAKIATTSPNISQAAQFNLPKGYYTNSLSNYVVDQLVGTTNTTPATVGLTSREDLVTINAPAGNGTPASILRILTPGQLPTPVTSAGPYTICGYPSFEPYVKSLTTTTTSIKGQLNANTNSATWYDYKMTVFTTLNPNDTTKNIYGIKLTGQYGYGALPKTPKPGSGTEMDFTLPGDNSVTGDYPLSWFLYGSPDEISTTGGGIVICPMTCDQGVTVANDAPPGMVAQILHDMEAGFTLGLVGSPTKDPVTKKPLGTESSMQWFSSANNVVPGTFPVYQELQGTNAYFNQYAAFVNDRSIIQSGGTNIIKAGSIYGAAYSDAVPGVTLNALAINTPSTNNAGVNIAVGVTNWAVSIGAPPTYQPSNLQYIPFGTNSIIGSPGFTTNLPYYSQVAGTTNNTTIPVQWALVGSSANVAKLTLIGTKTNPQGWRLSLTGVGSQTLSGLAGGTTSYQPSPALSLGIASSAQKPVISVNGYTNNVPNIVIVNTPGKSWTNQLTYTVKPTVPGGVWTFTASAQNPTATAPKYTSPTVGTVTQKGLITTLQQGNFLVTVGYGNSTNSANGVPVVVQDNPYNYPNPALTLTAPSTGTVGGSSTLSYSLSHAGNPTSPQVTYQVTNQTPTTPGQTVATITTSGGVSKVNFKSPGTCYIQATLAPGNGPTTSYPGTASAPTLLTVSAASSVKK